MTDKETKDEKKVENMDADGEDEDWEDEADWTDGDEQDGESPSNERQVKGARARYSSIAERVLLQSMFWGA